MVRSEVLLAVNGERLAVPSHVDLSTSLADFIRTETRFKGTKVACWQGGCGACAVEVSRRDPATGKVVTRSINSCLAPIGGLDGAAVTTAEGIGNSQCGFHPVQERLGAFHASQCGFCTPGFVIAMHGVLRDAAEKGKSPTADDFQAGLDGNLCRCTGYRPIVDACKSLTGCADLEDLGICAPGCKHAAASPAELAFPAFLQNSSPAAETVSSSGRWLRPRSLQELAAAVQGVKHENLRLLAGNTGTGIYGDWPDEAVVVDVRHIQELDYVHVTKGELEAGAAVSLSALVAALQDGPGRRDGAWQHMVAHLLRIAGTHVRNAATVGGNLALSRQRHLESDLTTVLMGAGASVSFVELANCADARAVRKTSVEEFLGQEAASPPLVLGISVPDFGPHDVFRSHKVAQRFYNSHAVANAALSFRRGAPDSALSDVQVALGRFDSPETGKGTWSVGRLQGAEAALEGKPLAAGTLVAALRAARRDLGADAHPLIAQLAEGMLMNLLAPLAPKDTKNAALRRLLDTSAMQPPAAGSGRQSWPDCRKDAPPVHLPVEKDAVKLQASGEATYTSDIGVGSGQLFAATVATTEAAVRIVSIDTSAAEQVPGFVAFISAKDVPRNGSHDVFGDALFATDFADYAGQRIGLAVADSQKAAQSAAAAVKVEYSRTDAQGNRLPAPILTMADALAANSLHEDPAPSNAEAEQAAQNAAKVDAALASAQHSIRGAAYTIGSQQHFYMEPQVAVAVPDEGGSITVHSATQTVDAVQRTVATTLGIPFHQVKVVCRRLGGAFGGKSSRCLPPAAAAAVAAMKLHRPVRYVLSREDDMRQNQGRCATDITYDVGFQSDGKLTALRLRGGMLAGFVKDLAGDDISMLKQGTGMAYDIPALDVDLKLAKGNLAPHTIMRGPGYLQAVMVIEQIVEHVAAKLGLDAAKVKQRNFIGPPANTQPDPLAPPCSDVHASGTGGSAAAAEGGSSTAAAAETQGDSSKGGLAFSVAADGTPEVADGALEAAEPAAGFPPRPCFAGPAEGLANDGQVLSTAQGKRFRALLFTLPRIWSQIQEDANFEARVREVREFNARSAWRKRGIAITPVRFDCSPPAMAASVHVYPDGSVLVASGGLEMGQGLFTKVKQMAAYALGQAVAHGKPLPLSMIRVGDTGTDVHPGCGTTWSSTGSEGACQAVRLACEKVVRQLRPIIDKADPGASWEDIITAAQGDDVGHVPTKVFLSAMAWWDGSEVGGAGAGKDQLNYVAFGAGVSEVEIDVLTGEKVLRRTDILFDCGHSLNPGIDIGQVEGAFVQGLGIQTLEEVVFDDAGRLVTDNTWHYKIPTPADIPRQLNVTFLKDSPNPRGIMSSKASGEPCLMLSAGVLAALQNAVAAARAEISGTEKGAWRPLTAPATTVKLRGAVGDFSVADMLEAALQRYGSFTPQPPGTSSAADSGGAAADDGQNCGSPASSGGRASTDSSWEVL